MDPKERDKRIRQLAVSYLVTALLALRAAGALGAQSPPLIHLSFPESHEVLSVTQEVVKLSDFVKIEVEDPKLQTEFACLEILDTPKSGKEVRLTRQSVLRKIRQAGLPFTTLRFRGPTSLKVLGPGRDIASETVLDLIKADLLDEHGWLEEELCIEPLTVPERIRIPVGEAEIHAYRVTGRGYGTIRYDVTAMIDRREVVRRQVIVKVSHVRPVWVVQRKLQAGQVVTADNVRQELRKMVNERRDQMAVTDVSEFAGRPLRRSLSRGVVITEDVFGKNITVRRGQKLSLHVRTGSISVRVQAKALESGETGETIVVQNLANGQKLRARIVNGANVEVI